MFSEYSLSSPILLNKKIFKRELVRLWVNILFIHPKISVERHWRIHQHQILLQGLLSSSWLWGSKRFYKKLDFSFKIIYRKDPKTNRITKTSIVGGEELGYVRLGLGPHPSIKYWQSSGWKERSFPTDNWVKNKISLQ